MPALRLAAQGSRFAEERAAQTPPPDETPLVRPDWLDDVPDAAQCWDRLIEILERNGLLDARDIAIIERYCWLYSEWSMLRAFFDGNGNKTAPKRSYTVRDADGRVVAVRPLPQYSSMLKIHGELVKIEREFGLTPSARLNFGAAGAMKDKRDEDRGDSWLASFTG